MTNEATTDAGEYASNPLPRIVSAAEVGFAVAAQVKADNANGPKSETSQALGEKLDKLMVAPSSTATDALAFATVQECIMLSLDFTDLPDKQRELLVTVRYLSQRIANTLQIVTGLHRSVFTGDGETAN